MNRIVCFILAFAFLSGCESSSRMVEGEPVADWKIIPGERIGAARLGMTRAELYALLGEPTHISGLVSDESTYHYTYYQITSKSTVVDSITTENEGFATPEGLRVNMSALAVEVKLGKPMSRRLAGTREMFGHRMELVEWTYPNMVLRFEDSTLSSITIHRTP